MSAPQPEPPAPADCPGHDWANAITTWRICRTCGDVEAWDRENECADGGA